MRQKIRTTIWSTLCLLLTLVSLSACSQMDEEPTAATPERGIVYRLSLDAQLTGYDGTRAVSSGWRDGDTLHISFDNDAGKSYTTIATYSESTTDWTFTLAEAMADGQYDMNIKYIARPANAATRQGEASFDYTACAYECTTTAAANGTRLTAYAVLKPLTGRICFKTSPMQEFRIKGLRYYDGITAQNEWSTKEFDNTIMVDSTITTFYYLALDTTRTIITHTDGHTFSKQCSSQVLAVGTSGYLTIPTTASYNGWQMFVPEYVDLGLPSGTLWATCNVGAITPEGYGDYFAWGETKVKDTYKLSTYKWCNGSYETITKYCTDSSYGTVDNKTTLELADDAANVNWGGNWRMPTEAEIQELRDHCTWSLTQVHGVNGFKISNNVTGKSIFLPAAGSRIDPPLNDAGSFGFYWSSSLCSKNSGAYGLDFYSVSRNVYYVDRYFGRPVRPVMSAPVSINADGFDNTETNLDKPSGDNTINAGGFDDSETNLDKPSGDNTINADGFNNSETNLDKPSGNNTINASGFNNTETSLDKPSGNNSINANGFNNTETSLDRLPGNNTINVNGFNNTEIEL